jgi:hypothetical protein
MLDSAFQLQRASILMNSAFLSKLPPSVIGMVTGPLFIFVIFVGAEH